MLIRNSIGICLIVALLALASCGGSTSTTPAVLDAQAPDAPVAGLPGLPLEAAVRTAGMSDGPVFNGDTCVAFAHGALTGGEARLESSADPHTISWALYQIPEPVGTPHTLGVEAIWYDSDPYSTDSRDGYWLGFGNYDTGNWELHGPFTQRRQRVYFPPGMDVVSPGGDIAVIAFCENGNRVDIRVVQVGVDIGPGYEEFYLGRPPGAYIGEGVQVRIDSADNPHTLYSVGSTIMDSSESNSDLRWTWHDGTDWQSENLDLTGIEKVRWFQMAVGDGGRRAALVKQRDTSDDLYLFYDDGTGMVNAGVVTPAAINESYAGMTFVNSADDALGDRDLLVIAYSLVAIAPDCQTHYKTFDGTVFSAELILYPLATQQSGRISLTTGPDQHGLAGVPQEVAGDWEYYIGHYSAVANTWDFLSTPVWFTPVRPDWDNWTLDYKPDFKVRQAANGDIVAGYVADDKQFFRFGRLDAGLWLSTTEDQVPAMDLMSNVALILDVFTSGHAASLTSFGSASPQMFHGQPGSGDPWFRTYLSHEPWTFVDGDLAIDGANNTHMMVSDFASGGLTYYRRDAVSHAVTSEVIDIGGGDFGQAYGFSHGVLIDNQYHVFYVDSATGRVMYSVLEDGVTLVENEAITEYTGDWPYYTMGAGYLEDSDILYVAYMDYMTLSMKVVSSHLGEGDWEVHPFLSQVDEIASIADNESEIGALGYVGMLGELFIGFAMGDPRTGPHPAEVVSLSRDHADFPFHLAYNDFNGQWCMACNDDNDDRVNYFLRTPLGSWIGPFLVAEELGPGTDIDCGGITINQDDGTVRIPLMKQIDADPNKEIWVYSASNGSGVFTPTQKLMTIDTTTHDYDMVWSAPRSNGEPVVVVFHRLIGDPDSDARFFAPDAPDSWANIGLWDTPLGEFFVDMEIDDAGGIFLTAVDMDGDERGRVLVRYPW